jgi:hypothetical protein
MLIVCQSIWLSWLIGWENHAIFAARSPPASKHPDRFCYDASKYQRPREVARRPRGSQLDLVLTTFSHRRWSLRRHPSVQISVAPITMEQLVVPTGGHCNQREMNQRRA